MRSKSRFRTQAKLSDYCILCVCVMLDHCFCESSFRFFLNEYSQRGVRITLEMYDEVRAYGMSTWSLTGCLISYIFSYLMTSEAHHLIRIVSYLNKL